MNCWPMCYNKKLLGTSILGCPISSYYFLHFLTQNKSNIVKPFIILTQRFIICSETWIIGDILPQSYIIRLLQWPLFIYNCLKMIIDKKNLCWLNVSSTLGNKMRKILRFQQEEEFLILNYWVNQNIRWVFGDPCWVSFFTFTAFVRTYEI